MFAFSLLASSHCKYIFTNFIGVWKASWFLDDMLVRHIKMATCQAFRNDGWLYSRSLVFTILTIDQTRYNFCGKDHRMSHGYIYCQRNLMHGIWFSVEFFTWMRSYIFSLNWKEFSICEFHLERKNWVDVCYGYYMTYVLPVTAIRWVSVSFQMRLCCTSNLVIKISFVILRNMTLNRIETFKRNLQLF